MKVDRNLRKERMRYQLAVSFVALCYESFSTRSASLTAAASVSSAILTSSTRVHATSGLIVNHLCALFSSIRWTVLRTKSTSGRLGRVPRRWKEGSAPTCTCSTCFPASLDRSALTLRNRIGNRQQWRSISLPRRWAGWSTHSRLGPSLSPVVPFRRPARSRIRPS